jgi:hypothetical protein
MINKCANPFCKNVFVSTTSGRLFSFVPPKGDKQEHFWLCDSCASYFTMRFDKGRASLVEITQQPRTNSTAA